MKPEMFGVIHGDNILRVYNERGALMQELDLGEIQRPNATWIIDLRNMQPPSDWAIRKNKISEKDSP